MTQVATPETVVAPFDGVELRAPGFGYRLDRRRGEFWIETDDPNAGARGDRVRRRVVMTTGSHHEQDFWFETGETRRIARLPFVFRIPEQQWLPDTSVLLTPPDAPIPFGQWNQNCIQCHVTRGKPRIHAPDRMDSSAVEFGIACEACHGPGAAHVAANGDPARRYGLHFAGAADPTIVNPKRLSPRLASHVCGQCHGITYFSRDYERRFFMDGWTYRPGDDLEQTRRTKADEHDLASQGQCPPLTCPGTSYWPDGMVRVSGREHNGLVESPCYKGGTFSCLSCHTMHPAHDDPRPLVTWADDQLGRGMDGDRACVQCHRKYEAEAARAAHSRHKPASSGNRCYNCHMPYTTWGLLKAIRSHQVESPNLTVALQTGRPNACNQCHLDRTLAWTGRYLMEWYGLPNPRVAGDDAEVAASAVWALSGDAGLRALAAWSMGWGPAQEASGTRWMAPILARLLEDPYDAVRFAAYRTARGLAEGRTEGAAGDLAAGFLAAPARRAGAARRLVEVWGRLRPSGTWTAAGPLLIGADGTPRNDVIERLLQRRDTRRIHLNE